MLPTLFTIAGHRVATYGVMYVLACLAGLVLVVRMARITGADRLKYLNFASLVIAGGTIGAVLPAGVMMLAGQSPGLLYGRWSQFGVVGGFIAAGIGAVLLRIPFPDAADACGCAWALGHAIGRIGCFAAGCCFGMPLHAPWAVVYHDREAFEISGTPLGIPLHPTQLYEAAAEALLAFIAYRLYLRRHRPGQVIAFYLLASSAIRFLIELVRAHAPADRLGALTLAQWLAIGFALTGLAILGTAMRQSAPLAQPRGEA